MYSSVDFRTFTKFCNHHHSLTPKRLITPQKPHTHHSHPPFPPTQP